MIYKQAIILFAGVVLACSALSGQAEAQQPRRCCRTPYPPNWHHGYAHTAWGRPVALVMPPTVKREVVWSWGVAQTQSRRIPYQFGRSYPGPYVGGHPRFRHTPAWPSHTDQFGVYSVRGPWK